MPPKGMQDDINWWSDRLTTKAPPPYQHLDHQLTCMHTQMPAPPSALGSTYKGSGGCGTYDLVGTPTGATLGGQNQSALNYSPMLFSTSFNLGLPFSSMLTTKGSLKLGTVGAAGTGTSTTSSSDSYLSSYAQIVTSSLGTSPAGVTPPTLFRAVFSPPYPYSSPPLTYLVSSTSSSLTHPPGLAAVADAVHT